MNSRLSENRREHRRLRRQSFLFSLLLPLVLISLFFTLVILMVRVGDTGMSPTLNLGDVVMFNRLSRFSTMPERGDIFALREEEGVGLGRIIGLPGESITIQNGNVYIDGVFLSEHAYARYASIDMETLTLQQGEFFILPDSREDMDPRDVSSMIYPARDLLGEALMIVSPSSRFGIF